VRGTPEMAKLTEPRMKLTRPVSYREACATGQLGKGLECPHCLPAVVHDAAVHAYLLHVLVQQMMQG
jgi:hypothetical protein